MRLSTPLAVLGLLFCLVVELSAQSVRVVFVSGQASVQRPEEPALRPAVKGETVVIGTRIVTGADGRLVLTPMPGIKSIVAPNTTLLLEGASETRTSDTNITQKVVLDLKEGAVVSDLQKPEGVTYDYSIRTARGLAGARGTTYTVGSNPAGIQTIVVAHGSITLNFSDGRSLTVAPGQLSITKSNGQTQKVESIGQLSTDDQKVAQKWSETTVSAIATAIDAGISVAPEALNNALAAAKGLGVTLSPETQKSVDGARDTSDAPPPEKQPGDAPPKDEPKQGDPKPDDPKPGDPKPGDPKPGDGPTDPKPPSGPKDPKPPILPPGPPPPPPPPPPDLFKPKNPFLDSLPPAQRSAFLALPGDIQNLLVALNEIDIAVFALSPDDSTGLAFTEHDLRTHLSAYKDLKQSNAGAFAMVKAMAGPGLDNVSASPDPLQWSAGAFERTLASWNALTDAQRALIIDLGAGRAIMDTSADYIQALLAQLTATDIPLIKAAGWGRYINDLAGKPAAQSSLSTIAGFSPTQRAVVKDFEVSPKRLAVGSTLAAINALASGTVSDADRLLMKQLGVGQRMLNQFETQIRSFSSVITGTRGFYDSLTAAQQTAARALDLGEIFYRYAPTDPFVGGGDSFSNGITALQRVEALTLFYNTHPALQQSLQDSRVLSFDNLPTDFFNAVDGSHLSLVDTLALYDGLPSRTRAYLDSSRQNKTVNFYELANPALSGSPLRPLADINALLGGLTAAQFSTLIDLDLSKAVLVAIAGNYDPTQATDLLGANPQTTLIETITTYQNLPPFHKQVLRELGIIGDGGVSIIGADVDGLNRLLTAYAALDENIRATTERLDERTVHLPATGSTFGTTVGPPVPQSFFFTRGDNVTVNMTKVRFESAGDLHVGATRHLIINGSFWSSGPTFTVGYNHDLYLYAADLIDLTSTNFSNGIRSIPMAAATINLTNINFPNGSVASLNSKLGGVTFDGSKTVGRVNFFNVSYGGNSLNSMGDLTSSVGAAGNIAIGTLASPAALPSYTRPTNLPVPTPP